MRSEAIRRGVLQGLGLLVLFALGCQHPKGREGTVREIDTNGIRLTVAETGHGDETLLLLHFGGGNRMMWSGLLPYVQDRFRVVLVDQRGHGRSDKPVVGNHADTMAVDVLGVLDALGIRRAHVLGSSLGAEVALSLASAHPGRVQSLVLEGALYSLYGPYSAGERPESAYDPQEVAQWTGFPVKVWDSEEAMVDSLKTQYAQYWNPVLETFYRYGADRLEDGRVTEGWRKWARDAYIRHHFAYRFENNYPTVICPVLMLPAEAEWRDVPTRTAIEKMCQISEDCRIEAVPGLMHAYGWMLMPEALAQVINAFWDSLEAVSSS